MRIAIFTPAEKRLALLLFTLTVIGLLARGGRTLSPQVSAWLDEVADGDTVHVPAPGETETAGTAATAGTVESGVAPDAMGESNRRPSPVSSGSPEPSRPRVPGSGGSVNPNIATLDELTTLPGVGPVLARRILDDRVRNGRFRSLEDLSRVSGIGKATLKRIRPHVTLAPPG